MRGVGPNTLRAESGVHAYQSVAPAFERDLPAAPAPSFSPDEIERLRAREYELLAALLGRAPNAAFLAQLSRINGDDTPLGRAHRALGQAAREADADALQHEFFDLFIGVGRGELLPYASYYLTGFLNERPLARVRGDLALIGAERTEDQPEPEDHIALLCEVMAGLAAGRFEAEASMQRTFFERHLKPWAERFFADLEHADAARFYRAVGALGRLFMEIEAEAFAMDA